MAVISFKCPYCDGELIFDPATGNYKCEYCISSFTQDELNKLKPDESSEQKAEAFFDSVQEEQTASNAVLYTCPSCGAEIITDATTAATFCYYCHNPVILGGRLEGTYLPDKIIPFEITKEQAVKGFLDFVGQKKFVPKAFFSKKQIEMISGVYFPYWNYNADVESVIDGEARTVRTWTTGDIQYTETKHYHVMRKGIVSMTNLTENALQKANAELAKGLMPYDFDKMKEFHMGYLSGFMAEKRDIEKESLRQDVQNRVKGYADTMMRSTIPYTNVNILNNRSAFEKEDWQYCLLPVWTITYKGSDGKMYYYSMNGQTGEVCGELPLDRKKLKLVCGAVSVALFILCLIGGILS